MTTNDDPDIVNVNEVTIDFTSTPDPIRGQTTVSPTMTTTTVDSTPSTITLVLQDILLMFGMENIIPEHRSLVWQRQRLGRYYDFHLDRIHKYDHPTGWDYFRESIATYVQRAMGAMLSSDQAILYHPHQHLQIYVNTSDGGFSDVLHEPSYDRTMRELSKYIRQESLNLINFGVTITFFSPAFLTPLSVPQIHHQPTRLVNSGDMPNHPTTFPAIPQENVVPQPVPPDRRTTVSDGKSVSWTPAPPSNHSPRFERSSPWSVYEPHSSPTYANESRNTIDETAASRAGYPQSVQDSPDAMRSAHDRRVHSSMPGIGISPKSLAIPIPLDIGPRNPRNPYEVYGSRFFIHDHLPYDLRRYWQPEKIESHPLPPFTTSTTGFRWYESCCDHLLSHGVYLPPYHCLRINQPLGTSWDSLLRSFPEARERLRPWSRVLRNLLQKLVDSKGVTHPIPGASKFADIVTLCDNDGYQAFYDIMEYHATQLNLPAISNVKAHNIPRMKSGEHLKQFTHRFQEHFIQRYYRNGYNVQPPELYALYMDSLPTEIVRHFRARIWTFDMDNYTSSDSWTVGNMDFRLHFDHIVKAIMNECKLYGMQSPSTSTAVVRKSASPFKTPLKAHALVEQSFFEPVDYTMESDEIDCDLPETFIASALNSASDTTPTSCKFCSSPNHKLSQCLSLARLLNGFVSSPRL
jgi:hypothetical protein